jgi:hypothetical protein
MIHETLTNLDPDWGELLDIDVLLSGYWAGIFRGSGQLFVRDSCHSIPVPLSIEFALIRCLEPGRVVLVNPRTQLERMNACVLSIENNTTCEFYAGDGIEDVLASQDTIAATYFDEGVYGGPPGNEGIAIFNTSGEIRAGYRSTLGSYAVSIDDCYAACWERNSHIAFCPYSGFEFVSLDVLTLEQHVDATHRRLHGSAAIAVSQDKILFYKRPRILAWAPGREPSLVGHYYERLRGLFGGRFIAHRTNSFTIIEAAPPIPIFEKVDRGDHAGFLQILLYEDQSWEEAQEYAQQLVLKHDMKLISKINGPETWQWYVKYKGNTLIIGYDDYACETIICADTKKDEEGLKALGTVLALGNNEK